MLVVHIYLAKFIDICTDVDDFGFLKRTAIKINDILSSPRCNKIINICLIQDGLKLDWRGNELMVSENTYCNGLDHIMIMIEVQWTGYSLNRCTA